jgi:hypothetical protein
LRQLHVLVPKGYKLLELRAKALPHAEFVVSPLVCARMVRERRADVCLSLTDIGGRWIGQAQLGGSFHVQTLETVESRTYLSPHRQRSAWSRCRSIVLNGCKNCSPNLMPPTFVPFTAFWTN